MRSRHRPVVSGIHKETNINGHTMAASTLPPKLEFVTLDVFTNTRYLGNPLAVVFVPADQRQHLTQKKKQSITQEFNLSETVFFHVPTSKDADTVEIDIFCCECELPFAGHPTIGTAYLVLKHLQWSHVKTLLTKAGPISITALAGSGVKAQIPHAVHVHKNSLGSLPSDKSHLYEPYLNGKASIREAEKSGQVVSIVRGMTFVMIKLDSLDDLALITESQRGLNFGKMPGLLDQGEWAGGFVARYYYVLDTAEPVKQDDGKLAIKLRTRMAELASEDPATGSASSALACRLALDWQVRGPFVMKNTQGVEMGRKSDIEVEVVPTGGGGNTVIKEVYLSGEAKVVMSGNILL
jgi:pre-mRNA-processing factor 19